MDGFLVLNKPAGLTSHDCVAKVRRSLRQKRVGHAGTLDPAAAGVLPIAIGRATRLLQFLPGDKAYRATIRLGIATTTDDLEGEILAHQPAAHLTRAAVETALQAFVGTIQQIPPNFSAVQVQGQRLYDLARKGEVVTAPTRTVEIDQLELLAWRSGTTPELDLEIHCGAGTYIRAIARDLGQVLQTGGTLAVLLRTASSGFRLADAMSLEELVTQVQAGDFHPIAPDKGLAHLDTLTLPDTLAHRWSLGQRIVPADLPEAIAAPAPMRIYGAEGHFLGIGQWLLKEDTLILKQQVVFPPESVQ